jgi:hypothetical protein
MFEGWESRRAAGAGSELRLALVAQFFPVVWVWAEERVRRRGAFRVCFPRVRTEPGNGRVTWDARNREQLAVRIGQFAAYNSGGDS